MNHRCRLFLLAVLLALSSAARPESGRLPAVIVAQLDRGSLVADAVANSGDFHIVTAHLRRNRAESGSHLFIFRGKRQVLARRAPPSRDSDRYFRWIELPLAGPDVTGEGQADALAITWSGGAHCCATLEIYSLSATPRRLARVELGHGEPETRFVFPRQGPPVMLAEDWAFAYGFGPYYSSPIPLVPLRFDGRRFSLATDLLRWDAQLNAPAIWRHHPDLARQLFELDGALATNNSLPLIQRAREIQLGRLQETFARTLVLHRDQAYTDLAEAIHPLVYGGDLAGAEALVKAVWPKHGKGQGRFWSAYMGHLKESLYWGDLKLTYPSIVHLGRPKSPS